MINVTPDEWNRVMHAMIESAKLSDGALPILDSRTGAQVATFTVHDLPKRPKDMPRHLRPKMKLSKRQRVAAKRAKLAAA
jgi:hypothetical protein